MGLLVRAVLVFWLYCLVGVAVDFVVYLLLVFSFIVILGTFAGCGIISGYSLFSFGFSIEFCCRFIA